MTYDQSFSKARLKSAYCSLSDGNVILQLENNFSDQDEEKDLGEELLGKERAGAIKNFCKRVGRTITCAWCRKKKSKRARLGTDDEFDGERANDQENQAKPILSPESLDGDKARTKGAQGKDKAKGDKNKHDKGAKETDAVS